MLRRPVENKNSGPYRKLLIKHTDEFLVNKSELNRTQIFNTIVQLENSINTSATEKQTLLEDYSITETDYRALIAFLKDCITYIDRKLPSNTIDPDGKTVIRPIERVLLYENFEYHLVLNSEKYDVVFPKPLPGIPGSMEKPEIKSMLMRDYEKRDNGTYISLREPYVVCKQCESIENIMIKNGFYELRNQMENNISDETNLIYDGWHFAQSGKVHNFLSNTLIDPFLNNLRVDEIKKTYWCSSCGSLIFTRLFSKINENSIELGTTFFAGEEIPKRITIDFPENFIMYMNRNIANLGNFIIYNNGIFMYNLRRDSATSLTILKNTDVIGNINFDISTKQMEIIIYKSRLTIGENQEANMIDTTKNTTFLLEINTSAFLVERLNSIDEYETIKSSFVFDNDDSKDYVGCIMRNDVLASPVIWSPKKVTFGELRKYPFQRLGIDLMLFHDF